MENINKFTPFELSQCKDIFKIPIYQRLFEWEEPQIIGLLDDLYYQYISVGKNSPYYIGMLTTTNSNDLVDGQQRFIVLNLIGICMKKHYSEWEKFLVVSGGLELVTRLQFSVRKKDQDYINSLILENCKTDEISVKIKNGKGIIEQWITNKERNLDKESFAKYIFEYTTFFIAKLPDTYKSKDLNKYFEAMNSYGKNLENHEILKVECLKKIKGTSITEEEGTRIWNAVSFMGKQLIRKKNKKGDNESDEELHQRYDDILSSLYNEKFSFNDLDKINDFENVIKNENNKKINIPTLINKSIGEINEISEPPKKENNREAYHCMFTFTEFLLLVLYKLLSNDELDNVDFNYFFNSNNLLEVYDKYTQNWELSQWEKFFIELLKFRLIVDYYIIRIPNNDDGDYDLEFSNNNEKDNDNFSYRKLKKYQSMLYAESSIKTYYKWVIEYINYIEKFYLNEMNNLFPTTNNLLDRIKEIDNDWHPKDNNLILDNLVYSKVQWYWFRRLDYYIWEQNLATKKDIIIENFKFVRGGRSVEHLHPQNQEKNSKWDKNNVDNFGNLCLISSSFNSTQSNDAIEVKFGRIEAQMNNKRIEDVKLYEMYKKVDGDGKKWTVEVMLEHQKEMLDILKNSYST